MVTYQRHLTMKQVIHSTIQMNFFLMTKYGIEEMIGKKYKNNMPAYKNELKDIEIIAVLSYIKSTCPDEIQKHHDSINSRWSVL